METDINEFSTFTSLYHLFLLFIHCTLENGKHETNVCTHIWIFHYEKFLKHSPDHPQSCWPYHKTYLYFQCNTLKCWVLMLQFVRPISITEWIWDQILHHFFLYLTQFLFCSTKFCSRFGALYNALDTVSDYATIALMREALMQRTTLDTFVSKKKYEQEMGWD